MRFASLVLGVWLSILGGCLYWDHGKGGECKATPVVDVAPIMLVNPSTLQCQSFSETICDPSCGLCPAEADLAPAIPTWGACQSACTGLAETNCLASAQCRAARDWARYYSGGTNSFVGCFALDTARDTSRNACAGRGAEDCSRTDACTALYEATPNDCATCADEQYKECIPKTQAAGACSGSVICALAKPTCPTNTVAGVADGCWTGSCIPQQFCPQAGG